MNILKKKTQTIKQKNTLQRISALLLLISLVKMQSLFSFFLFALFLKEGHSITFFSSCVHIQYSKVNTECRVI